MSWVLKHVSNNLRQEFIFCIIKEKHQPILSLEPQRKFKYQFLSPYRLFSADGCGDGQKDYFCQLVYSRDESSVHYKSLFSLLILRELGRQEMTGYNRYKGRTTHSEYPSMQKNQIIHTLACLIHTFISSMFFGPPGPDCKPHMYRMRHVFPHPVSPIITTGMPHLEYNYSDI